jgi:hypothetical protein
LATYILLRGITLLIRTGNKPRAAARHPLLHAALAPTRLAHGDTLLMCCAASQIVYAFIMMPQTLPPSYVRFIRKQGAKELYVWRGIRVRLRAGDDDAAANQHVCLTWGATLALGVRMIHMCSIISSRCCLVQVRRTLHTLRMHITLCLPAVIPYSVSNCPCTLWSNCCPAGACRAHSSRPQHGAPH